MNENLTTCLDKIGLSEAGYVDHPEDRGGPTNRGITQRTLAAWRKHPVSIDDVKMLTVAEARDILASQYAAPIRFDDLPAGLDYCVFDCSVNSGPNRAGRLLQETLGMTGTDVDGVIGAHTLAELSNHPGVGELVAAYCDARLAFCKTLANWGTFGKGWTLRIQRVRVEAAAMVRSRSTLVVPPPLPLEAQAKASGAVKVTTTGSGKAALINVGVAVASAVVSAGGAVSQVTAMLQPYANIAVVRYALLGLTVMSATGTFVVAWGRAKAGGTT